LGNHTDTFPHYSACLAVGPRVVEPFLWHRVYRLAAAMPDSCRVNRTAFREAFKEALGLSGWLSTSSGRRMRLNSAADAFVAQVTVSLRSRWDRITGQLGRQGPWSPAVNPLDVDQRLNAQEMRNVVAMLEPLVEDGDPVAFLRSPAVPYAVRLRAITLAFAGAALDST
jgi:hypothetical protein